MPVTIPLADPIVATAVGMLLHVPPPLISASSIVDPTHTVEKPLMGDGSGLTVTVFERLQFVNGFVAVTVTTPGVIPVTIPLVEPTVAMPVELLLHVTPADEASVIVEPTHTADGPLIVAGKALTVTTAVVEQPLPIEYVIVARPAAIPATMPVEEPTVAVPGALLVQLPPGVRSLNVVVNPMHTCSVPVMGAGAPVTQKGAVT